MTADLVKEVEKLRKENEELKEQLKMNRDQVGRYSRQLLMPEIGVRGQLALLNASVLIVGAGGLGAPSALYLAAAGIGTLGILDYDVVELNNLHRQVIHTEGRVGISKAESAKTSVHALNSSINCITHATMLTRENALDILRPYDVVLDCTDNVATRYLLNDACILLGKPLVSGSALRMEGQLTVYNFNGGPCYRCLFPNPPPANTVTNCGDGGVLGSVPGVIGCLQAMEATKVIMKLDDPNNPCQPLSQRMLLLNGLDGQFRTVRLRNPRTDCAVCGEQPTVQSLIDYEEFCGSRACDKSTAKKLLESHQRITCETYRDAIANQPHLLLDVRDKLQYDICSLPSSINIPLSKLKSSMDLVKALAQKMEQEHSVDSIPVYCVCRRGNASQSAVKILDEHAISAKDIIGGLTYWATEIDPEFPMY